MKQQFDNQVISSFLMWFDHTLLEKGDAYYTVNSTFPANNSYFKNYYAYNGPYKGLVYDTSITGATVMTGVYVNNVKYNLGSGPVSGVNYYEGQVYSPSGSLNVSGTYSVKEFNVLLTSQPEETLLFETQYSKRNKLPTGILKDSLAENTITYPVVFLKNNGSSNTPAAFGGTDETRIDVRAIVIADSQYNLDAVCSLFRDRNYDNVPLISESDNPFNVLGSFKNNAPFNYNTVTAGKDYCMIDRVSVSKISSVRNKENMLNPSAYFALIDFELIKFREPRKT
jgi:hypothetical protein